MYYRLYLLGRSDGHFVGFEEIEADDDAAALASARASVGQRPAELWCGRRKVASLGDGAASEPGRKRDQSS